jgi:7-cyano-7-deazaguanine synthase
VFMEKLRKQLAVVLASGGLDSCVTLAIAKNEGKEIALLHASYGQRTEAKELRAVKDIALFYQISQRLFVPLNFLKEIGGSSLTDEDLPLEESSYGPSAAVGDPNEPASNQIPSTYVPFRNSLFLAVAVSWAEALGAAEVYIGASQVDAPGYPDCRQEYFEVFGRLIEVGTRPETRIEIVTPLIGLSKAEIVKKGADLGAPLHLTWSCYQNQELACGNCSSCRLRLKAFKEAAIKDPIPYAKEVKIS